MTPLFMGSTFKKWYKQGDELTDAYGDKYYIRGFLPKNVFYINPYQGKETFQLDNCIVSEIRSPEKDDNIGFLTYMANTFLIAKSKNQADDVIAKKMNLVLTVSE